MTTAQAADAGGGKATAGSDASLKDVQREWSETSTTLMAYGIDRREQALDQSKKFLSAMGQRMDRLEVRAAEEWSELSTSARQKRSDSLRALRRQRNEVAQWYGGMMQSSVDAWSEVKKGFIDAYGSLSDSFIRAARQFDRAGEPDGRR